MFEDTNPERWTPERAANDAKIWARKYLPAGTLPRWEEPRVVAALRLWNLAQPAHKRFKTMTNKQLQDIVANKKNRSDANSGMKNTLYALVVLCATSAFGWIKVYFNRKEYRA